MKKYLLPAMAGFIYSTLNEITLWTAISTVAMFFLGIIFGICIILEDKKGGEPNC